MIYMDSNELNVDLNYQLYQPSPSPYYPPDYSQWIIGESVDEDSSRTLSEIIKDVLFELLQTNDVEISTRLMERLACFRSALEYEEEELRLARKRMKLVESVVKDRMKKHSVLKE